MAQNKVRADIILRQIAKRHQGHQPEAFFTEVKNGSSWFSDNLLRLDAVAFKKSWKNPCITGYEVKVDRQDFLRDDKWAGYLKHCHRFYFACPTGLILPEELPDEVGLIYYNPDKNRIYTKRKAAFRVIDIPWEMLYYLVISRLDSDRHPFFSSRREYLEAWVKDKEDRKYLGYEVKNKMAKLIDELTEQVDKLSWQLRDQKEKMEQLNQVKEILRKHGIRTHFWCLKDDLEAALSYKIPPTLMEDIKTISKAADRLINSMGGDQLGT